VHLTPHKLLKLACLYEIFGCNDCAAEVLLTHREALDPLLDIEHALDLLTPSRNAEGYRHYMDRFTADPTQWYPKFREQATANEREDSMTLSNDTLARAKAVWGRASEFPFYKERQYPEHASVQEFDAHRGLIVLEYGCGGGSDVRCYLERGNLVFACDIVPQNLMVAEENIRHWAAERGGRLPAEFAKFELLQNSVPLPFRDGMFDLVNSHGVIHHIPDAVAVLREFYRVLRIGGLCYVMLYTEHLHAHHLSRVKEFMAQGLSPEEAFGWCTDGPGVPYARYYTEESGRTLMERAGFRVVSAREYEQHWFRTYKGIKGTSDKAKTE
jgi:SAM-dependent methyltransferase